MAVPNTFATATSAIPLANLDANFAYYDGAFSISGAATTFSGAVTLTSNLTFTGTGNRITGDFSNATVASRVMFQSSTVNGNTVVGAMPNGTSGVAQFGAFSSAGLTDYSSAVMQVSAATGSVNIISGQAGAGSYYPILFLTGGSERIRLDTSGNVGIGTSSPSVKLDVRTAAGTAVTQYLYTGSNAAASTLQFGQIGAIGWDVGITATTGNFQIGVNGGGLGYNINRSATAIDYHSWLTAGSERMRIDSSGRVLINLTASKTYGNQLQVVSSINAIGSSSAGSAEVSAYDFNALDASPTYSSSILRKYGSTAAGTLYFASTIASAGWAEIGGINVQGGVAFGANGAVPLVFANSAERMRIDSSGNVGIGTSSPITTSARLSVKAVGDYDAGLAIGSNASAANWARLDFKNTNVAYSGIIYQDQGGLFNMRNDGAQGIAFSTNGGNERMRIDSSGNVGIGTNSPGTKLEVLGPTRAASTYGVDTFISSSVADTSVYYNSTRLVLKNSNSTSGTFTSIGFLSAATNDYAAIWGSCTTHTSGAAVGYLAFGTNNGAGAATERMRINSTGSLLLGAFTATVSPAVGCQLLTGGLGQISIGHDTSAVSGNYYASFAYNSGVIGSITQSGTTAVLYNVTSDQRLKENIQDAESASTLIDSLQVRQFDWKTDNTHQRYGFIAQELVTVAPEAVHQPTDPEEMMAVDYSKLVPMLVKEIQSLRKRLADAGIA